MDVRPDGAAPSAHVEGKSNDLHPPMREMMDMDKTLPHITTRPWRCEDRCSRDALQAAWSPRCESLQPSIGQYVRSIRRTITTSVLVRHEAQARGIKAAFSRRRACASGRSRRSPSRAARHGVVRLRYARRQRAFQLIWVAMGHRRSVDRPACAPRTHALRSGLDGRHHLHEIA